MLSINTLFCLVLTISSTVLGAAVNIPNQHHNNPAGQIANGDVTIGGLNKLTNAQRLARGLSPLPPTRRYTAPKVRRSGTPAPQAQGVDIFAGGVAIKLRRVSDGIDIGVMTLPDGDDAGDLVDFDPNASLAQKFSRGVPSNGNDGAGAPFSLVPLGTFSGSSPLLAVLIGSPTTVLAPGSSNYAPLGLAQGVSGGLLNLDLGQILVGGQQPAQEAIWTLGASNQLIPTYPGSDGSSIPVYILSGGPCQHLLCLSADIGAFKDAFGNDAYELQAYATVL